MKVSLWMNGNLRRFLDWGESREVEVVPGTTVEALMEKLGVPKGEVWLISVNGELKEASYLLEAGDDVRLFEPVTGGSS